MIEPHSFNSPVTQYLDQIGAPYRIFIHPGAIHSLEQAASERGQTPDQVIRSILFRTGKDEYIMVLMAGKRQISWPLLRQYLKISRITLATEEEVQNYTGYSTGAVSPFGIDKPVRILADDSVFIPDEISIGSGQRGTTVILQQQDFRKALKQFESDQFST